MGKLTVKDLIEVVNYIKMSGILFNSAFSQVRECDTYRFMGFDTREEMTKDFELDILEIYKQMLRRIPDTNLQMSSSLFGESIEDTEIEGLFDYTHRNDSLGTPIDFVSDFSNGTDYTTLLQLYDDNIKELRVQDRNLYVGKRVIRLYESWINRTSMIPCNKLTYNSDYLGLPGLYELYTRFTFNEAEISISKDRLLSSIYNIQYDLTPPSAEETFRSFIQRVLDFDIEELKLNGTGYAEEYVHESEYGNNVNDYYLSDFKITKDFQIHTSISKNNIKEVTISTYQLNKSIFLAKSTIFLYGCRVDTLNIVINDTTNTALTLISTLFGYCEILELHFHIDCLDSLEYCKAIKALLLKKNTIGKAFCSVKGEPNILEHL